MAEEAVIESSATPEVQKQAEAMGWIPASRYKGDVERFVDAEEFIQRGETVLPIVKKQLETTRTELAASRAEAAKTAAALKTMQESLEAIEERHSVETQKAVEKAREQLKTQLAKASEAGDHEAVAELTDELTRANAVLDKPVEKKKEEKIEAFVPPADLVDWNKENEWFGKDEVKTAMAMGIAQKLRKKGITEQGRAFFDLISAEVAKRYKEDEEPIKTDKVEGARGGAEGETRMNGKKGYASLPADAKQACDADAKKFVGEGKKYKDIGSWRAQYATLYFSE